MPRQLSIFGMPEGDRTAKRRKFEALKAAHYKRYLSKNGYLSVTAYKLRAKAMGLARQLWPDARERDRHTETLFRPDLSTGKTDTFAKSVLDK